MRQKPLTKPEEAYLASLNDAVAAAISIRRAWLDRKMMEASKLQIGDDIYDLDSGKRIGTVTKLYRFWRDRDDGIRDMTHHCDYEFEASPGCLDNTSRHGGTRSFGTREEAAERAEYKARLLR